MYYYMQQKIIYSHLKYVYVLEIRKFFWGLWEQLHNPRFKGIEFTTFESEAGKNSFYLHLVILNNLENINAQLIKEGFSQKEHLIKLNKIAKEQIQILKNNKNIKTLEDVERNLRDRKLFK